MATERKIYIANDGVNPGGYDAVYTSLTALETTESKDLVADDTKLTVHLKGEENSSTTAAEWVTDWVCDATRYMEITAEPGAEFNGDFTESGVATIVHQLTLWACEHADIHHFRSDRTSTTFSLIAADMVVHHIGIFGDWGATNNSGSKLQIVNSGANLEVYSCIITNFRLECGKNRQTKELSVVKINGTIGANNRFHNNVISHCFVDKNGFTGCKTRVYGIDVQANDSDISIKNNLVVEMTQNGTGSPSEDLCYKEAGTNPDEDYNAGDDTSFSGTNSISSITPSDEIVDSSQGSSFDFHLKAGNQLAGAGVDPGGVGDTDYEGQQWVSTWDIGADKPAGGTILPQMMQLSG